MRDPSNCALPIDPSAALRYRSIAQIAETRATITCGCAESLV